MVGIYRITSPSGKVYIGQSINIPQRWAMYRRLACQRQRIIYSSFIKYGVENHSFEIIHELPKDISRDVLNTYEQLYIDLHESSGYILMNLNGGGYGNKTISAETRRLISLSKIGNKVWVGRQHSEVSKEKIRSGNSGKVFTPERRLNISNALKGKPGPNKGKKLSEETRKKIGLSRRGAKMANIVKENMRLKLTGRIFSEEHRKKLSEAGKGRKQTVEHIRNNAEARRGGKIIRK